MFLSLFPQTPSAREKKTDVFPVSSLVERCRRGDCAAFDALVGHYQDRIYNLCLWQLGDADEAADAAQESFIRAWRSIGKFRGECAFSTWLHRIAVNATHDAAARRQAAPAPLSGVLPRAEDDGDELANLTPDSAALPADEAARRERQRVVRRALAALAPGHRIVLVLFDIEGHSYDEAAVLLEVPIGTVKSRLNRARLALREQLEPQRELFED